MLPMYYRRANAAIIVYDVTSAESFLQVTEWINGMVCILLHAIIFKHFQSFRKTFLVKLVSQFIDN